MDLAKWKTSPIYITVRSISANSDVDYKTKLSAVLHTTEQDYPIFKVLSQDIIRDYNANMMDDVQITVMVPLGDYIYLVYPNKDNMEMTVRKTILNSIGDAENNDKSIEEIRYKCIFDTSNPSFSSTEFVNYQQIELNNVQFVTFKLRLMDRNVEPMRIKTVQGVFRGVLSGDLIKAILLGESQKVLVDGVPAISGIDIVEPDNLNVVSQVVLPSGTHVCEVPTILQEDFDGVYKYGMGTYYQRYKDNTPMWFVFPTFNFDRFDSGTDKDVAIFYSAPSKYTTGIEHTYRTNAGVLEVIVTTDKHQINVSEIDQLNRGVGFRVPDYRAFMKKPVIINDAGKPLGARGNLNSEVSFIDRTDGLNYVPSIKNKNTNLYHETSKVSARQATILHFGWANADESKIYPGMPFKYVYMENDEVHELKGTILGVHAFRVRQGKIAELDRYSTNCVISVATELNQKLPIYDGEQSFDQSAKQTT